LDNVSYAHLFSFLAAQSRTLSGKVLRPFVLPELQAIIEAQQHQSAAATTKGAAKPQLKRSASLMGPPSLHHAAGGAADASSSSAAGAGGAGASGSSIGLEAAKLLLSFVQWLTEIRVDASPSLSSSPLLTLKFDFGSASSGSYVYVDLPSQPTWVLSSGHAADKFLVHPLNQPKIYRNASHRLCLHKEMQFKLARGGPPGSGTVAGVRSLRAGDVSIKKFVTFNADVRTEHRPGMIEYDDSRNAFLTMRSDEPDKPLIVDGRYQPRSFDYWLVLSVLKQETWVGLPHIGRAAPYDVNMKPHPGSSYP
jgi:hypothetical protein